MGRERELGQFFTPPVVARFMVRFALRFLEGERRRAIDPACGDGVFLSALLDEGFEEVWGVDIDPEVVKLIPRRIRDRAMILVSDSLLRGVIPEGYFDLVVGNPPFSAAYGRVSDSRLSLYELGRGRRSQAVEVLFLERFIQLARPGGVIAIILPDGVVAGKTARDAREFVLRHRLLGVVSLPHGTFRSSGTNARTHAVFIRKEAGGGEVIMAEPSSTAELLDVDAALSRAKIVKPTLESLSPRHYHGVNLRFRSGLEVVALGELVDDVRLGVDKYSDLVTLDGGLRFITSRVVTPLGLDFSREPRRVRQVPGIERYSVKPGDLLLVRKGEGIIGRAAVAVDGEDSGIANDWVYIIRLREMELLPRYVAVFLQTKPVAEHLSRISRGVGCLNLPISDLLRVRVPLPPGRLLEEVSGWYERMVRETRAGRRQEASAIFSQMLREVESEVYEAR